MEYKYRRDIVGKRFLAVKNGGRLKLSRISGWEWRSGVIRACTERDFKNPDISVLVEFDGKPWQQREWIKIREVFQLFLIEKTIVWAPRPNPETDGEDPWPALNYLPVVDKVGLSRSSVAKPVEFFPNNKLEYVSESKLRVYKESDQYIDGVSSADTNTATAVRQWFEYQNGQQMLLETPSVLIGYRAKVYRADGTTQWYTAVINSYDESTKELHVTDDTVLEEHTEDPTLVQICLIGDGVVDAILRGENTGVRPSRTRRGNDKALQRRTAANTVRRDPSPIRCEPTSKQPSSSSVAGQDAQVTSAKCTQKVDTRSTSSAATVNKGSTTKRSPSKSNHHLEQESRNLKVRQTRHRSCHKSHDSSKPAAQIESKQPEDKELKVEKANCLLSGTKLLHPLSTKPVVELVNIAPHISKNLTTNCCVAGGPRKLSRSRSFCGSVSESDVSVVQRSVTPQPIVKCKKLDEVSISKLKSLANSKVTKERSEDQRNWPSKCHQVRNGEITVDREEVTVTDNTEEKKKSTDTNVNINEDDSCSSTITATSECNSDSCPTTHATETSQEIESTDQPRSPSLDQGQCSHTASPGVSGSSAQNQCDTNPKHSENNPASTETQSTSSKLSLLASKKSSNKEESLTMALHYKKMMLVDKKEKSGSDSKTENSVPPSGGIDVNHSILDQIARLNKGSDSSKKKWDEQDAAVSLAALASSTGSLSQSARRPSPTEDAAFGKRHDTCRTSETGRTHIGEQNNNMYSRTCNDSSTGGGGVHSASSGDKEEQHNRPSSGRSEEQVSSATPPVATASSGVSQESGRSSFEPYRDPELLKRDSENQRRRELQQPTAIGQRPSHTPIPPVSSSYPAMHTPIQSPIPTGINPAALPAAAAAASALATQSHPLISPLGYTALAPQLQISAAHLQMANPGSPVHALVQQQQQVAAATAAHLQQLQLLQQQQQQQTQILSSFSLQHNSPHTRQLELLWQQKFPNMPMPPAWVLHQYQEDLLRDVHLLQRDIMERERRDREILEKERCEREQRERAERERIEREQRERAERERLERERLERERAERERQERERQERERREKLERERAERERAEREKAERERKEKERLQREQQQRLEREHILMESSAVADAVNQHFQESFMRLTQKTGSSQPHGSMLMAPAPYPHLVILPQQHPAVLQQQPQPPPDLHEKNSMSSTAVPSQDMKSKVSPHDSKSKPVSYLSGIDAKTMYPSAFPASSQPNKTPMSQAPPVSGPKSELNFNLYGYQPHPQMYISQDKLVAGLKEEKVKVEAKSESRGASTDSKKSNMAQPPPLIRDKSSSVIVENKPKDVIAVAPPAHHGSITLGTAIPKLQTQGDVKPLTSVPPVTSVPSSTMAAASILASLPIQDIRLTAGQQNASGLNLTVSHSSSVKAEPVDGTKTVAGATSTVANSRSASQCPMSSMAYSYGLMQQSMGPNPMYCQTTNKTGQLDMQAGNQPVSSPGPHKRRSPKEPTTQVGPRKKPKMEGQVPVSSVPTISSGMSSMPVSSADAHSQPTRSASLTTTASDITATQIALAKSVTATATYMDSFRSFVMNAVQLAFMNDEELSGQKNKQTQCTATSKPSVTQSSGATAQKTSTPLVSSTASATNLSSSSCLPLSSAASTLTSTSTTQISNDQRPGPASTPGGASVSSTSSLTDTINRVTNNMDTDSDTLSAPSPPGTTKWDQVGPSPQKSSGSSHTKGFKKAWLARYSDQDRDKPFPPSNDNSNQPPSLAESVKSENSMDSLPASNGSATVKEEACPSPVACIKDVAIKEEIANSSASEAESQSHETGNAKKRTKLDKKRQQATDKKAKEEKDSSSSAKKQKVTTELAHSPGSSTSSNCGKKKKKTKNVKSEDEQVPTPQKPESPPPIIDPPKPVTAKKTGKSKVEKPEPKPMLSDSEMKMEKKLREKRDNGKLHKDSSLSSILANKPLNKEPVAKLKKSLEPFLQDGSCTDVTPKLTKCRECKMTPNQRNKKIANANIFCRFYAFRRLRFSPRAYLTNAGFSEPSDADADDIELWYPCTPVSEPKMTIEIAKYVIAHVGDRFCELVEQERIARSGVSPDTKIAWKRAVQGVREMCDVCDTTLFNMHWVCHKCGFVVCIDCYKLRSRKSSTCTDKNCKSCEKDGHKWLTCSVSRQAHEPDKLMLTQIIPSDVLWVLGRMIHEVREQYNIQANCPCGRNRFDQLLIPKNGISQSVYNSIGQSVKEENKSSKDKSLMNGGMGDGDVKSDTKVDSKLENGPNFDPLNMLAVAAVYKQDTEKNMISDKLKANSHNGDIEDKEGGTQGSTLRDLLTQTGGAIRANNSSKKSEITHSTLEDIIQKVVEKNHPQKGDGEAGVPKLIQFKHYRPRNGKQMQGRDSPIPTYTLSETMKLYPDIPHEWLDYGRLLRLTDPKCKNNIKLFQQQWRRAQPVVVSNCDRYLCKELWQPSSFARDFGDLKNDLVNCTTNSIIVGHKMRVFWDGFEKISARLKDNKHQPMNLKLKDWPPTEDFAEILPKRFADLMQSLPLPEYTNRAGVFNLASRLPEFFVKPDLGPKMYNAYGSSRQPGVGTTNLHLDVSDAVNLMLYVGIPSDDKDRQEAAAMEEMNRAGACELTKQRVKEAEEKPGALWHIYDPQDADKIRDLLNKVGKERGEEVEAHHDPIHDQSWYLDEELRERLLKEYGVQGYTIVQCLGDAVFIPAGAPHQVRNLHSCIKAAEDFVSPENMNYCFRMTQEFRHLSDTHTNHEDKLQIKNIIYHAVKDAVALLREHNS